MRLFGWAVCRFSRMLRSSLEQALRLGHVAAPHGLLHLRSMRLRSSCEIIRSGARWFWSSAAAGSAACAGRIRAGTCPWPGAVPPSGAGSPRRALPVHRLVQALLGGAQFALRIGEVAVLDLQRHGPEPVGDIEQVVIGLGAAQALGCRCADP